MESSICSHPTTNAVSSLQLSVLETGQPDSSVASQQEPMPKLHLEEVAWRALIYLAKLMFKKYDQMWNFIFKKKKQKNIYISNEKHTYLVLDGNPCNPTPRCSTFDALQIILLISQVWQRRHRLASAHRLNRRSGYGALVALRPSYSLILVMLVVFIVIDVDVAVIDAIFVNAVCVEISIGA